MRAHAEKAKERPREKPARPSPDLGRPASGEWGRVSATEAAQPAVSCHAGPSALSQPRVFPGQPGAGGSGRRPALAALPAQQVFATLQRPSRGVSDPTPPGLHPSPSPSQARGHPLATHPPPPAAPAVAQNTLSFHSVPPSPPPQGTAQPHVQRPRGPLPASSPPTSAPPADRAH